MSERFPKQGLDTVSRITLSFNQTETDFIATEAEDLGLKPSQYVRMLLRAEMRKRKPRR